MLGNKITMIGESPPSMKMAELEARSADWKSRGGEPSLYVVRKPGNKTGLDAAEKSPIGAARPVEQDVVVGGVPNRRKERL
jgi:hypothetical protein